MKAEKVIFGSFVAAATAPVDYAKLIYVDLATHVAMLGGQTFGGQFGGNSVLAYKKEPHKTTVFYVENGIITTRFKESVENLGFVGGVLVYGPKVPKTHFDISETLAITNKPFYSCKMKGSDYYGIFYDTSKSDSGECINVNIYVWPRSDMSELKL